MIRLVDGIDYKNLRILYKQFVMLSMRDIEINQRIFYISFNSIINIKFVRDRQIIK
jgi:hypothetical protein